MINPGQIYREKSKPYWRKNEADIFVVCYAEYSVGIIYKDGKPDFVGREWIKDDCELIAEYPDWREAVNAKEFKE